MAEQVIRTFDLYNTSVLLPGYSISGYENEFGITKGFYSTDFSSNPIGSKVDFFVQLGDPCVGVLTPNPVFTVPVGLSALNPLWFDQWWDEAMFYSHPLVLEQLQTANPSFYQTFSDSVGTMYYSLSGEPAVNPALESKVPKSIFDQITRLNSLVNTDYKAYTPTGFGPNLTKYNQQLSQYQAATTSVKNIVNNKFPDIKRKLPLNVVQTGNLITPPSWQYNTKIQGVNTAVDRLGNVIKAPGRTLAGAVNKVKSVIPTVKLPTLPSVGKLVGATVPGMPAASNLYGNLKAAGSTIQAGVTTAQGTLATAQGAIAAGKNTVGSVQSAITNTTGTVQKLGTNVASTATALTNINKTTGTDSIIAAMKNQSSTSSYSLNNNSTVIVNKAAKNAAGDNSVTSVNTFEYKKTT